MGESTANALASTPAKKAMTRTMGKLGKMQPRPSKRDFFRASTKKCAFTRKIGPVAGSLRGNCRPGAKPAERLHSAGWEVISAAVASSSASLRSVRTEMVARNAKNYAVEMTRGGKLPKQVSHRAWKSGRTPRISTFPPRRRRPISFSTKLYRAPPHLNFLTDADHLGQDPSASVASLRW